MRRNTERYFNALAISVILASIVFVYAAGVLDPHYQGEDYMFVSQVNRLGFARSVALSWKDHFLPLYRVVMGGLHVLFSNAVPVRTAILLFHLVNTLLIYLIVRGRTRSIALATVAGATFGLSRQSASEVLFPINGHWVMSLTFLLLMSMYLDKFLQSRSSPGLKKSGCSEKSEDAPDEILRVPDAPLSTRDLTEITMKPAEWLLKYYYFGLLCFALGLGFFTIALGGGVVIWGFMYLRILRVEDFRKSLRLQAMIVLPLIAIIATYLLLRSYFNELSRPYLLSMTSVIMNRPEVSATDALKTIAGLRLEFYSSAIKQTMPYFKTYSIAVVIFLGLLLVKEFIYRRREAAVAAMWLGFAAVSIALPAFGRLFFILRGSGNVEDLLFPWYFYVPVAGVSISLGLLLRVPPLIEQKVEEFSAPKRAFLLAAVIAILAVLNFKSSKEIMALIPPLIDENQRFDNLLAEYRDSMSSFLHAREYSRERTYYFKDGVAARERDFPMSWYVMHHDIFYLYYPDVRNIRFIGGFGHRGDFYFWTPEGITKKQWQGWL